MVPVNYLAVLAAAVAAFSIGFLFHGPLFGKTWMRLAGIHPTGKEKLSDMVPQMAWNLLANLVTASALAFVFHFAVTSPNFGLRGIVCGVTCAVVLWLGFIVTSTSIDVIWMGRSVKLWLFECACSLAMVAAMGAIIALWR
ncbi:MAG TPA: DUF1761 domain-containing protein [Candidatus Paceibacterota bacterium]|nr:DUF1761 domain-containing protein [Candidatus Paceibacterota bacterium]